MLISAVSFSISIGMTYDSCGSIQFRIYLGLPLSFSVLYVVTFHSVSAAGLLLPVLLWCDPRLWYNVEIEEDWVYILKTDLPLP